MLLLLLLLLLSSQGSFAGQPEPAAEEPFGASDVTLSMLLLLSFVAKPRILCLAASGAVSSLGFLSMVFS